MMRPLDVVTEPGPIAIRGPLVLETNRDVRVVITELQRPPRDDQDGFRDDAFAYDPGDLALRTIVGQLKLSSDRTTGTITGAEGTLYALRRMVDDDGIWASDTGAPAPADSLERLYEGGFDVTAGPLESLWAALDPDTRELRELIYSSPSGVYARSSGAWHKFPDDDASLDGLESVDVGPEAVRAFDESEGQMTGDDVMAYAVPDEGEEAR